MTHHLPTYDRYVLDTLSRELGLKKKMSHAIAEIQRRKQEPDSQLVLLCCLWMHLVMSVHSKSMLVTQELLKDAQAQTPPPEQML